MKLYKVTWLDAVTRLSNEKPIKPYKKYLETKETAGLEIFEDRDVLIIKTERVTDDTECDYTYIPKKWVIKIEKV